MPVFRDQTGRSITINHAPQRIVSLVPSQTELLADLGLEDEVIGITKFCVHPERWFRNKARVGGTKQVKLDIIRDLRPDLIIANKEENTREQIEALAKQYPVWISDITQLTHAYEMIQSIGRITGKETAAEKLITTIKQEFSRCAFGKPSAAEGLPPTLPLRRASPIPNSEFQIPKAAYLIWKAPYMTIGHDTFIHAMLETAGFSNVFANKTRYPETSIDELLTLKPEVLLLSSEPYPFKEKHIKELQAELPDTKILLVDGEMFSWYGSRLRYAPAYFLKLNPLSS